MTLIHITVSQGVSCSHFRIRRRFTPRCGYSRPVCRRANEVVFPCLGDATRAGPRVPPGTLGSSQADSMVVRLFLRQPGLGKTGG